MTYKRASLEHKVRNLTGVVHFRFRLSPCSGSALFLFYNGGGAEVGNLL